MCKDDPEYLITRKEWDRVRLWPNVTSRHSSWGLRKVAINLTRNIRPQLSHASQYVTQVLGELISTYCSVSSVFQK